MRDIGMAFDSILDLRESPFREKPRPVFLQDLNLDQVIDRISLYWGENVSSLYVSIELKNPVKSRVLAS